MLLDEPIRRIFRRNLGFSFFAYWFLAVDHCGSLRTRGCDARHTLAARKRHKKSGRLKGKHT